VAASLIRLWVTSGLGEGDLLAAYERVVSAVTAPAWGPPGQDNTSVIPIITMVLRTLTADAHRLSATDVANFVYRLFWRSPSYPFENMVVIAECLAAVRERVRQGDLIMEQVVEYLSDLMDESTEEWPADQRRRMAVALYRYHPGRYLDLIAGLD
jgi:hypothetical protein